MTRRDAPHQELDLTEIIAGPVRATVDADAYAARSYIEILREYGFTKPSSNDPHDFGEIRMISFRYQSLNERGQMQNQTLKVPLLSLIPLPILEVTEARFNFNVRIISHAYDDQPAEEERAKATPWSPLRTDRPPRLRGVFTEKPTSSERSRMQANIGATIQVRRADMPAGIGKLLNLLQNGIIRQSTTRSLAVLHDPTAARMPKSITVQAQEGDQPSANQTILAVSDDELLVRLSPSSRKTDAQGKAVFDIERHGQPGAKTTVRFLWYGHADVTAETQIDIGR